MRVALALIVLVLAGCGGGEKTPQQEERITVVRVELPDGRVVTCVKSRGDTAAGVALSCDWDHAEQP